MAHRTTPHMQRWFRLSASWRQRWQRHRVDVAETWSDYAHVDVAHVQLAPANPATASPDHYRHAYETEQLHLYQRRIRVTTFAAMLSLPLFWLLYAWFVPTASGVIGVLHGGMFATCFTVNRCIRRAQSVWVAQRYSEGMYIIFALTSGAVMVIAPDAHLAAVSGHAQIILSLLFMPFSFGTTAWLTLVIVFSYAIGVNHASSPLQEPLSWWYVASMFFTGVLVTIVAYLQGTARRHAFDSAFTTALSTLRSIELSNRDAVTGGFNRRHLETVLDLELARAARLLQPLAVIMFDLDHFKPVNDTLGHHAGDDVLREVLRAASAALRDSDTVARYGGDEFVVVLPASNAEESMQIAERLRDAVRAQLLECFGAESLQCRVTLSVGVAVFAPDALPSQREAIALADSRLYHAKRDGRDRIHAG